QPIAGIDRNRQLLVLLVDTKAPRMESDEPKDKRTGRHRADIVKEAGAENAAVSPAPAAATATVPALAPAKQPDARSSGR
ncbi:MAG TPA: rod shape-determining protein MreC, partial [Burkholderiaceae bacterium]|nr:rod shape-determining protein MreC [Burkholderiaceae bacterium]